MRSASGPRLFSPLSTSASVTTPTRASRPRAVLRRAHRPSSSVSACGAPARCGGQSASMPPGTGRSRSSTASPTAEPCSRAISRHPPHRPANPLRWNHRAGGQPLRAACCRVGHRRRRAYAAPHPLPATPRPIGSTELNNKGPKARYIRADGPRYPLRRPERSAPKARAIRAEGPSYPLRRPELSAPKARAIRSEGPSYPLRRRPSLSAPKARAIRAEGPSYPR